MLNINNENVKDSLNKNNIKNKVDGSKKNSKMDKNSILSTFYSSLSHSSITS
jgi:hypothetical protein